MADKAKSKSHVAKCNIIHFGLIKLFVLKELKKMNRDWNTFLFKQIMTLKSWVLLQQEELLPVQRNV